MGNIQSGNKKSALKISMLAAASVGIYAALFANEASVITYYTKGGAYAALPVLTAFAFSIIHGSFAGQCLEALGLTASISTRESIDASKKKKTVIRKDQRPRLEAN